MSDPKLGKAFAEAVKELLNNSYSELFVPNPVRFSTGIRTLDAQLGGGIYSSHMTHFTATPETGKSTVAMQFGLQFLKQYPSSIILYIDVETVGDVDTKASRWRNFDIDPDRVIYKSVSANIKQIFELIHTVSQIRRRIIQSTNNPDIYLYVVIDSLAAIPGIAEVDSDDPNSIIGRRAREFTHFFRQYSSAIKREQIFLITIDQVRYDIQIQNRFQKQPEKTVGSFRGFKAATNVAYLQHSVSHWLHMMKGKAINANKSSYTGVDGWFVDILTEKNKYAASQVTLRYVFDKRYGIHPFWSEYHFLKEWTPSEKEYYGDNNPHFDLLIKTAGAYKKLVEVDEDGVVRNEFSFYEREAYAKYLNDPDFKESFDRALEVSIKKRIVEGLLYEAGLREAEQNSQDEFVPVSDETNEPVEANETNNELVM